MIAAQKCGCREGRDRPGENLRVKRKPVLPRENAQMKSVVVVGAQWGDEGKGKVVDYLSGTFDYIARVAGGRNPGATALIWEEPHPVTPTTYLDIGSSPHAETASARGS